MKKTGKVRKLGSRKSVFGVLGISAAVFTGAFAVAFLASSNFMPAFNSDAAEINVSNSATGYYANVSTIGAVDIDLEATPDGTAKVGKDTVTVNTNAKAGYKLYISTVSGADGNALYLEDDDTKSIPASSGTVSTPVALATNTWGYIPSRSTSSETATEYTDADVASSGSATVIGVPEYGSENVLYTNNAPTTASTNTVDVYYGVNASTAIPSGTYSNTVVYTAVVDAVNTDSVDASIAPASQEGLAAGTPITISTGLYPGFAASDMGEITVTIGGNACTGITPVIAEAGNLNVTCTAPAATTAGKKDVVVNVAKYNKTYTLTEGYEYVTIDYMQDFSAAAHSSDATGTTYTLSDSRDETEYQARKLADGNIWMIQNLHLVGSKTLTPADSNVTTNFTLTASNSGEWCQENSSACDDQSMVLDSGNTSYGTYYNWYAATAGTGKFETSGAASASICPKGWRLPTNSEFQTLYNNYNSSSAMRDTNGPAFVLSGNRSGGSTNYQGSNGSYWSSVAYVNSAAYNLYLNSSSVNPQGGSGKWRGVTVRCIADKTALSDITSMQEMTSTVVANTPAEYSKTLTDTRDNKTYTVTKLADDNVWMTQDLKLGGSSALTLTPDDSDVTSNYTLPAENTGTWCNNQTAACYNQSLMIKTGVPNGYLYNWYAATAGTGVYGTSTNQNASASICPKGWKLPTMNQYVALDQAYGGSGSNRTDDTTQVNKFLASPLNFNYTGYRHGGSIFYPSDNALYWARTANSETYAYSLYFYSNGGFYPQGSILKYRGLAVRCVARDTM